MKRALVIGAGVGGLTAAMKLRHAGLEVEVLEKQSGPGGRCGRVEFDGFRFDLGPTILLMPHVLEETFASVGRKLTDVMELTRCDPHYRVHYRDRSRFTLFTEPNQMAKELDALEPGASARYRDFLAHGKKQHDIAFERFVTRHFEGLFDFVTPSNVPQILRVGALSRLWSHVSNFFSDDRLKQALSFQTMYLGISPWEAPAVFSLLPYTEATHGIWFPKGGLHAVPLALERVAREDGVTLSYRTGVKRFLVEGGRVVGVELEDGAVKRADVVVCNADYAMATEKFLPPELAAPRVKTLERRKHTSSGVMLYLGVKGEVSGLLHHNVFFGRDFKGSFDDIFEKKRVPGDVSFYVNAPTRTDKSFAPEGHDALYVLVPVPHLAEGQGDWNQLSQQIRTQVLERLKDEGYGDLAPRIVTEKVITPIDWRDEHFLAHGSNFGLAQNFWQIGPFRPRVQDPDLPGLYWCGASIQPGTGVPTVMLSARFAVEAVLNDLGVSARKAA